MKDTLILLHGALGAKGQFHELITELKVYFDVHAINFEGHGGRLSKNDYSIDLFTGNVIDYIQSLIVDRVVVFGYSMGGYVALNAAMKIPKRISKVITLGTKFKWDMMSAEKEVKMLNPIKICLLYTSDAADE